MNLNKPLTEKEKIIIKLIISILHIQTNLYKSLRDVNNSSNTIDYKVKEKGPYKGQYGYFISSQAAAILYLICCRLKLHNVLDLGSGPGIMLTVLNSFNETFYRGSSKSIKYTGYEIEDDLVTLGRKLYNNIYKKDIITITKEDIKDFDCLYFWEPLQSDKLAKSFVDNLNTILIKDQVIVYNCSGNIINYLENSPRLERIRPEINLFSSLCIYKVIN